MRKIIFVIPVGLAALLFLIAFQNCGKLMAPGLTAVANESSVETGAAAASLRPQAALDAHTAVTQKLVDLAGICAPGKPQECAMASLAASQVLEMAKAVVQPDYDPRVIAAFIADVFTFKHEFPPEPLPLASPRIQDLMVVQAAVIAKVMELSATCGSGQQATCAMARMASMQAREVALAMADSTRSLVIVAAFIPEVLDF